MGTPYFDYSREIAVMIPFFFHGGPGIPNYGRKKLTALQDSFLAMGNRFIFTAVCFIPEIFSREKL